MQSQQVIGTYFIFTRHNLDTQPSRPMNRALLLFAFLLKRQRRSTLDSRQQAELRITVRESQCNALFQCFIILESTCPHPLKLPSRHWSVLLAWERNTVRTVQRRKILFLGSLKLLQPQQPSVTHYIKVVILVICLPESTWLAGKSTGQLLSPWPFLAGIFHILGSFSAQWETQCLRHSVVLKNLVFSAPVFWWRGYTWLS